MLKPTEVTYFNSINPSIIQFYSNAKRTTYNEEQITDSVTTKSYLFIRICNTQERHRTENWHPFVFHNHFLQTPIGRDRKHAHASKFIGTNYSEYDDTIVLHGKKQKILPIRAFHDEKSSYRPLPWCKQAEITKVF